MKITFTIPFIFSTINTSVNIQFVVQTTIHNDKTSAPSNQRLLKVTRNTLAVISGGGLKSYRREIGSVYKPNSRNQVDSDNHKYEMSLDIIFELKVIHFNHFPNWLSNIFYHIKSMKALSVLICVNFARICSLYVHTFIKDLR